LKTPIRVAILLAFVIGLWALYLSDAISSGRVLSPSVRPTAAQPPLAKPAEKRKLPPLSSCKAISGDIQSCTKTTITIEDCKIYKLFTTYPLHEILIEKLNANSGDTNVQSFSDLLLSAEATVTLHTIVENSVEVCVSIRVTEWWKDRLAPLLISYKTVGRKFYREPRPTELLEPLRPTSSK
jgi:hypothetical protein